MKWLLAAVTVLTLAGCGVDWFPENTTASPPAVTVTITSFSPTHALVGAPVTITGTNFSTVPANNSVKFNGTTAAVTSSTATQIVTTVPTGASTGPITVTVGSSTATSSTNFTVSVGISMGGAVQGNELTLANSVTTLAGTAEITGATDGTGAAASFSSPFGITTDGTNLYVADTSNSTIRKIVIATGAVSTLAGTAGITGSADGTGAAASFNSPFGITTDGINLYVADQFNHTIRKIVIATGAVTTLAGTAGITGIADGTGAAASFNFPFGITTDGINLYVTDSSSNTIRKIVIATGVVTTLAGTAGNAGSTDGTGAAASFASPYGITMDGVNLYVVDSGNATIRKIVIATGAVTTLAGTAGTTGSADGTGAAASFDSPFGITMDGINLYVADTGNATIRKIVVATGAVTTLAGTAGTTGSADGTGAAASFNFPADITTNGTDLYVADTGNSIIRKIQ